MPIFGQLLLDETSSVSYATLTNIASELGSVATWFWGIFTNLIDVITTNDLLLWTVVFALVASAILMAYRFVRAFGVRGRR